MAPLFGFFEVLIWLLAIGQIMKNLTNVVCYTFYSVEDVRQVSRGVFPARKPV
jgi:hypothetical protein